MFFEKYIKYKTKYLNLKMQQSGGKKKYNKNDVYLLDIIKIINEKNEPVDTKHFERYEQKLANKYIKKNDVVLELGARYGSVSCVINLKLNNKKNHVAVEPDKRVWGALEKNKKNNKCKFHIVKGFISNKKLNLTEHDSYFGYGTTFIEDDNTKIPSYTLNKIKKKYKLNFNVLVADCEGFLETFFIENPNFCKQLRLIIYEADYENKCNYDNIKKHLIENKFKNLLEGYQNVWIKN